MIHGTVAPGFELVREQFAENFASRQEIGGACAIYHRGEPVVDLWGGHRDAQRRRPWQADTLVTVYSTSKGLAAMTLAVCRARGLLDYDEPVARYWPEFAQNGKQQVTLRQLLSHQAGLCAIDDPLDLAVVGDFDRLADVIARQRPAWPPGTRHGYHAISIGFYEGELVRRVDPQSRSLGRFFAEEIAEPLGIEFYFGVPREVPGERIARIVEYRLPELLRHLGELPRGLALGFLRRGSLTARTFGNPRLRSMGALAHPRWQALEVPAGGGVGSARSIARAYSALATGGAELGIDAATIAELERPAVAPSGGARDAVLRVPTAFSLGFLKPSQEFSFSSSASGFGHPGAGGSFGFADPDVQVGYAYVMNRMGLRLHDDPRERALREAMYRCLAASREPATLRGDDGNGVRG